MPNWNETFLDGYIFIHSQKSIHHSLRSLANCRFQDVSIIHPKKANKNGNEWGERNWFDDLVPLGISLWYNYNLITQRQGRVNGSLQWYYSSTIRSWSKSLKTCLFIFCCQAPLFMLRWKDLFLFQGERGQSRMTNKFVVNKIL